MYLLIEPEGIEMGKIIFLTEKWLKLLIEPEGIEIQQLFRLRNRNSRF